MRPKYKVTGCARFFLFFIIFVPIVYFGAAYLRGEDGVQKLKDAYHSIIGGKKANEIQKVDAGEDENMELLEQQLKEAKERIKELEDELAKEKAKNQ